MRRFSRAALALTLVLAGLGPAAARADASPWRVAASYPLVFDVGGPRPDGRLVLEGGRGMALLNPVSGAVQPYAPAYKGTGQFESYIAVVPSRGAAGCFKPGDVYAIDQVPHGRVSRVNPDGTLEAFATVPDVDTLGGITFDTGGAFGGRLLVTGPHQGRITVAALGCGGSVTTVTASAPTVEGGITVAPEAFGDYGGDLIAPDELTGKVYAIAPGGAAELVATPDLPHGGDLGVEGAGFVPPGDPAGDTALFADRVTPGSPHPGNDYLLAASGQLLKGAGVQAGDLLLATEGGAALVAVRCPRASRACAVLPIIAANPTSHGEGHLLVIRQAASASPPSTAISRARGAAGPEVELVLGLVGLFVVALLLLLTLRRRGGVQTPGDH